MKRKIVYTAALFAVTLAPAICFGNDGLKLSKWATQTNATPKEFWQGSTYEYAGDYTKAVEFYRKAADQGYAPAQYEIALRYYIGKGVPQSYNEYVKWLRKAAECGYAPAQLDLGLCYAVGNYVPLNYTEYIKWIRKAADQEYDQAQYEIYIAYYQGHGVSKSYTDAIMWLRKAAEQGYAIAQYDLGMAYVGGRGVPINVTEALKWFREAALQGNAQAQYMLGLAYYHKIGVQMDFIEAYKWLILATGKTNDNYMIKDRNELLRRMTPEQIAEGQKRAAAFGAGESLPDNRYFTAAKPTARANTLTNIVARDLLNSIVVVETDKSIGTGFIERSSNEVYLLSNQHILLGASNILLKTVNGNVLNYDKFFVSKRLDLVRFCLCSNTVNTLPPTVGLSYSETPPAMNENISVFGNSQGGGVVTELRGNVIGVGPDTIEVDANFVQGNSGSPIINSEKQFVGIATYVEKFAPTNWVTSGTRFEKVRRFGLRLENANWIEIPLRKYLSETYYLDDSMTVLNSFAHFIASSIEGGSGDGNKCVECLLRFDKQLEQKYYHDVNQMQYIMNLSNCMKVEKSWLYPHLFRTSPSPSQQTTACRKLTMTMNDAIKKARNKLNVKYSTQFLNDYNECLVRYWDQVAEAVSQTSYQKIVDGKIKLEKPYEKKSYDSGPYETGHAGSY